MSHPLLTKVLAEAWAEPFAVESFDPGLAAELIAGMPPDIADRLEQALDVCAVCGFPQWTYKGPVNSIASHPMGDGHSFTPLVDLADDAPETGQGDI